MADEQDITTILAEVSHGDRTAVDRLLPRVYDELRGIADRSLRNERKNHTLQATALVHEAYMKLVGRQPIAWRDRAHFFALASQAIRRILVDHARHRGREKRGGGRQRIPIDQITLATSGQSQLAGDRQLDVIAVDDALTRLGRDSERKAKVVELRFFGGLTVEEVAEVLGITSRSVERDWRYARAWLFRELSDEQQEQGAVP